MRIAALIVALTVAGSAAAEEARPFRALNGRSQGANATGANRPRFFAVTPGGSGGFGVSQPAQAPAAGNAGAEAVAGGGRAFFGSPAAQAEAGRQQARSVKKGGRAIGIGRVANPANLPGGSGGAKTTATDPNAPAPAPTTTTDDPAPPNFSKPGALIRTEGQQPKYADPALGERQNTVAAGEIMFNPNKAYDVAKGVSIHEGPKDKLPTPNPGTSTGGAYGTGVGANSGGSTAGGGGSSGGTDGGLGGGHGGGDKGGDDKTSSDPTGFYSAF